MSKVASLWSRLGEVAGLVATPLRPADYVALIWPGAAPRKARVDAVHDEAPGVRTLTLRPGRGWRGHRAGQHVALGVAIAGRLVTRTFTISSAPERPDGRVTVTVKARPGGRVSSALVNDVAVGAFLSLGSPAGELVIDEQPRVPSLFVTGGSGITPIASMLRSFAARGAMPDILHVHHARTPDEVIFGEELRALAIDHPTYRLIEVHTAFDRRRLDTARLDAWCPDWREREAWACGPPAMLEALTASFASAGKADRLHVERFAAVTAPPPPNATGGRVTFASSGVTTRADGTTALLVVAEQAGLAPRHGCRMGICHSCDATLTAGRVRDLRTNSSIDEPGARIQICVCAAAGDVELTL